MKYKLEIWMIMLVAILYSCHGKFHHYEFNEFPYFAKKIADNPKLYINTFIPNKTYVLRLNNREDYIGNELVRFLDTTSQVDNHHMSYFVFKDDGRVFYNTFSIDRDSFLNKDSLTRHTDGIIPTIDICNPCQHYSRQGYYRLINYEEARKENNQKDAYRSVSKVFLEMELERKVSSKYKDKHYVITGEIGYDNEAFNDTLKLLNIKIVRKWSPIRNINSVETDRQQIKLDELFNFNLIYIDENSLEFTDITFGPCNN